MKRRGRRSAKPLKLPAAVVARYISGELASTQAIAELVGSTRYHVQAALRRLGVLRTRQAGARLARTRQLRPLVERVLRLRAGGLSLAEIAGQVGRSRGRIGQIVAEHAE